MYSPFAHILRKQLQVGVPLVANDLSTRETPDWDDLYHEE
jgi:hypothetical protein